MVERIAPALLNALGLHLRHPSGIQRLQRRSAARLPAQRRNGLSVPGRRHHRRLEHAEEHVLAAVAQQRPAHHPRQVETRHQGHFRAGQSRRGVPRIRRRGVRQPRDPSGIRPCGADGRRMLVLHGDEFDSVVKCSPWLAKLGTTIYDILLAFNPYINWVRRKFNLPHWSLSAYLNTRRRRPCSTSAASRMRSRGGAQARRRYGGLRPHSPRRNPRDQRHAVL